MVSVSKNDHSPSEKRIVPPCEPREATALLIDVPGVIRAPKLFRLDERDSICIASERYRASPGNELLPRRSALPLGSLSFGIA